ncbi:MAG: cytochrome c [Bacteroidales bacterium]
MFRLCARWLYIPLVVLVLTGIYYARILPEEAFQNIFHFNRESTPFLRVLLISSLLLFGLGLFTLIRLPRRVQQIGALLLVLISFGWMAGFEYLREIARKPYVLYSTMYSTGIRVGDMEQIRQDGFLASARWSKVDQIVPDNAMEAGAELFRLQCLTCHTLDSYNGIKNKSDRLTERGLEALLTGMGKVNTYMPPFAGTDKEKKVLAAYLFSEVLGKTGEDSPPHTPKELETATPDFNDRESKYVLLVWNDLGMHCISDNEKYFSFLPPANTFNAQLFRRGPKPELITGGVRIAYEVQDGFRHPEQVHKGFWEYDTQIFGADLPEGTGLMGKRVEGEMDAHGSVFAAHLIPVVPIPTKASTIPIPCSASLPPMRNRGGVGHDQGPWHPLPQCAEPVLGTDKASVVARTPWLMEPDCKSVCSTSWKTDSPVRPSTCGCLDLTPCIATGPTTRGDVHRLPWFHPRHLRCQEQIRPAARQLGNPCNTGTGRNHRHPRQLCRLPHDGHEHERSSPQHGKPGGARQLWNRRCGCRN